MINIEMDKGRVEIEMRGAHDIVLAEAALLICMVMESFSEKDQAIIKMFNEEASGEKI